MQSESIIRCSIARIATRGAEARIQMRSRNNCYRCITTALNCLECNSHIFSDPQTSCFPKIRERCPTVESRRTWRGRATLTSKKNGQRSWPQDRRRSRQFVQECAQTPAKRLAKHGEVIRHVVRLYTMDVRANSTTVTNNAEHSSVSHQ